MIIIENAEEKLKNSLSSSKANGIPLERVVKLSKIIYGTGDEK